MSEIFATRDDVRQLLDERFQRVLDRMEQESTYRQQQHAENQAGHRELMTEAQRTNGRVTRLEEATRILREEFQSIRSRWHSFRDSLADSIAKVSNPTSDLMPVTRKDLSIAIGILMLGMGAMLTIMKLIASGKVS